MYYFSLSSAEGFALPRGVPLHRMTEHFGLIWVALGALWKKYRPHCLWVIQQTHVCITPNNCLASISKNLVLPFSLLLSCLFFFFFFLQWQTQTRKPIKRRPLRWQQQSYTSRNDINSTTQFSLMEASSLCAITNLPLIHRDKKIIIIVSTSHYQWLVSTDAFGISRMLQGCPLINCIILSEILFVYERMLSWFWTFCTL